MLEGEKQAPQKAPNMTIQFASLASTLTTKPAALTTVAGASVANMTSTQAIIALAIQSALKGTK